MKNAIYLQNAEIDLRPGKRHLIVGEEDIRFKCLGGIISKTVPIKNFQVPWKPIELLVEPYTGDVIIKEGSLPNNATYIGPDPDHHLLFSRVKDNFLFYDISYGKIIHALNLFGLGEQFIDREMGGLSGGERMRVALALAFERDHDCVVLHGVLPWLDTLGRTALKEVIRADNKSCQVILEHEYEDLLDIIHDIYELKDNKLNKVCPDHLSSPQEYYKDSLVKIANNQIMLEMKEICFKKYPDAFEKREMPILEGLSYSFFNNTNYCIMGPNGSGKSTIAKMLYKIINSDSGEIFIENKSIKKMSREEIIEKIAYVSQFPNSQLIFPTLGVYKKRYANNSLVGKLLDNWIKDPDSKPVISLSILQQKMLVLLTSLTNQTKIVILDEPTWGMSKKDIKILASFIKEIVAEDKTMIIISHNESFPEMFNCKTLFLNNGKLLEQNQNENCKPNETLKMRKESVSIGGKIDQMIRNVPFEIKISLLFIIALYSFGSVFILSDMNILKYMIILSVLTILSISLLAATSHMTEVKSLLIMWSLGTFLYIFIAFLLYTMGLTIIPYSRIIEPTMKMIYIFSYPVRMLLIFASGLIFIKSISPLDFKIIGMSKSRSILLFRSIEYGKNTLIETQEAMKLLNWWPTHSLGSIIKYKDALQIIRNAPILISTAIRNIFVWSPWAWMCIEDSLNQNSEGNSK